MKWSGDDDPLGWFLWPIVQSAERLLTQGDRRSVKRCGESWCWPGPWPIPWTARAWTTVVGADATTPVWPDDA